MWKRSVAVLALTLQCLLTAFTFLLGYGWSGWTHNLALLVAIGAAVAVLIVARRSTRPGLLLGPCASG